MKRLLITGAHGFVGRHCLRPALESGFEVHGVLHSRKAPDDKLARLPVKWHRVDMLAPMQTEMLIREVCPSHILHAAWVTVHGAYWTSPLNLDWLIASARLALAFGASPSRQRLVNVGSCAEYAWNSLPIMEGVTAERPHTLYGEAKLLSHRAIDMTGRRLDFSTSTARIFFLYGPYEDPRRLIPHACLNFSAGKPAEFGSGRAIRDFMHIEDAGAALVALLNSDLQGPCNICSGQAVPIADIVKMLAEISGSRQLARMGALPDRAEEPIALSADNARLRSTGWELTIPLTAGLVRTFAWWQSNLTSIPAKSASS